jgi:CheY-like chemotaxis protein
MSTETDRRSIILVLEDVEETRDGMEKLLTASGYRVIPARSEADAIGQARREHPSLILACLGGAESAVIAAAKRVRDSAGLTEDVPIVVFCSPTRPEGAEVELGLGIYVTCPDNFDQLRALLRRLLPLEPTP